MKKIIVAASLLFALQGITFGQTAPVKKTHTKTETRTEVRKDKKVKKTTRKVESKAAGETTNPPKTITTETKKTTKVKVD